MFHRAIKNLRRLPYNTTRSFTDAPLEPAAPVPGKTPFIAKDPREAVALLKSHDRIFIQGAAMTPCTLVEAMTDVAKANKLEKLEVMHIHTEGKASYASEENKHIFHTNSFFIGGNMRENINEGRADFIPIFLSEIPLMFRRKIMPVDVAIVQVSPPDKHGFCSLGTSVDITRAALQSAKNVVGLVNKHVPRVHGDGIIHISHFHSLYHQDGPLHSVKSETPTPEEASIGRFIAQNLIEDGACLQMGIGSIPNAVLNCLTSHRDLGIHSEMFSDGILPLVEKGIITNSRKPIHTGKIIGSFLTGSQELYNFIDDNPMVNLLDCSYVNNPHIIAKHKHMVGINSCIEIDLTGQVVSDSIGTRMYSGVGGQVDFLRGAALSENGRPILALPSRTTKGVSRIVPFLKQGGGVVTTRAHVHYVVTEFGIAYLFGKNLRERAHALIQIAHPDDRATLEKAAKDRFKSF